MEEEMYLPAKARKQQRDSALTQKITKKKIGKPPKKKILVSEDPNYGKKFEVNLMNECENWCSLLLKMIDNLPFLWEIHIYSLKEIGFIFQWSHRASGLQEKLEKQGIYCLSITLLKGRKRKGKFGVKYKEPNSNSDSDSPRIPFVTFHLLCQPLSGERREMLIALIKGAEETLKKRKDSPVLLL